MEDQYELIAKDGNDLYELIRVDFQETNENIEIEIENTIEGQIKAFHQAIKELHNAASDIRQSGIKSVELNVSVD